jgi:hypothetical protein
MWIGKPRTTGSNHALPLQLKAQPGLAVPPKALRILPMSEAIDRTFQHGSRFFMGADADATENGAASQDVN